MPVITLTILNIITVQIFRKTIDRKLRMNIKTNAARNADNDFTRMSLTLFAICIVTRSFDMFSGILIRLEVFKHVDIHSDFNGLTKLLGSLTFVLMIYAHSFESLIYFRMDRNLARLITQYII